MSRILPILFNTEMVRAILNGRKTVTRRILKHDTRALLNSPYYKTHPEVPDKQIIEKLCKSPYEQGDILYVRETWHKYEKRIGEGSSCRVAEFYGYKASIANSEDAHEPWKPSIHMPKEAARIFLKVKDVRVERLQDITEKQAKKEGFIDTAEYCVGNTARGHFRNLWDSTIKKADIDRYSWSANPWVWVIEFERCEKLEGGNE